MAAAIERLDGIFSIRAFAVSLAVLLLSMAGVITVAGLIGSIPNSDIEKTIPIANEKTVAVNSGDLNQLDITQPPPAPKPVAAVEAAKLPVQAIQEIVPDLTEDSPDGKLPVIRKSDDLTPFKAYSAPFTADPSTKALVSFVMVDFGLSKKNSSAAMSELPNGVTFVLDAYTRDAQVWASDAHKLSHEIWLSVPLQSRDYPQVDTGPKTILASLSSAEAIKRLPASLGIATGYSGVVMDNADAFANSKPALQGALKALSDRGLGIVQADPADKTIGTLTAPTKAPFAQGNIWINQVTSAKDLQSQFINIESSAVKNKKIIVFFRPYPAVIKAIAAWAKESGTRGVQLAPLSAVVTK